MNVKINIGNENISAGSRGNIKNLCSIHNADDNA